MRLGIIVEGEGERPALKKLLTRINSPYEFVRSPLRADLQPKASNVKVIARSARPAVLKFQRERVDRIVVLIDREDHPCVVRFARDLQAAFTAIYDTPEFRVVVKDWTVENWLIADPQALTKMGARFNVSPAFVSQVGRNADACQNPVSMLNKICRKVDYDKGSDPARIMAHQDPLRVALNSRSFRRFLWAVGEETYQLQSRTAVSP